VGLEKLQREVAKSILSSIRADLSTIDSFLDLAKYYYEQGNSGLGDRTKSDAEKAIDTIRRFISTSPYIEPESKVWIVKRCDELQAAVAGLNLAKSRS
jgi:hypothetical protein